MDGSNRIQSSERSKEKIDDDWSESLAQQELYTALQSQISNHNDVARNPLSRIYYES